MERKLEPNGECWCGCGEATGPKAFFVPGHDRIAESGVIALRYGGVAELLAHHGFGPGGRNLRDDLAAYRAR